MGCYLEDYRARAGTWAARTLWATKTTWRTSQVNGGVTSLRENDSVYNDFSCAIGNWWGGEKSWTWCGSRENFASFV